ncbi:hypothetical protein FO519_002343 [Halicephalobus sp. NKZ332]|nr:hypothetical protein FO519_002343 [Halicephalobus sp. NKZ332]
MATCVIEQSPTLERYDPSSKKNSDSSLKSNSDSSPLNLWTSLQQLAANRSVGISLPVPSTSLNVLMDDTRNVRGQKRRASLNWTDEDLAAAETLTNMVNKTSLSAPASLVKPKNDPADILLHQLSTLCKNAQRNLAETGNSAPFVFETDKSSSTLKSTHLASHLISCFVVGGEIRLCAPQVYSVIMKDVPEESLTKWIRLLSIHEHPATEEQFKSLKANQAIPGSSNGSGLMTKTSAERLVGVLVDPVNYRRLPEEKRMKLEPILIQHDCFGGCEARLFPTLYPGPCVECTSCSCLMTPEIFCRHSHAVREHDQVCHWGFDAVNWKNYIRVHDFVEHEIEIQQRLRKFIQVDSKLVVENTLEEDVELAGKKSAMFNPLTAVAASLLAQQQVPTSAGPSTSGVPPIVSCVNNIPQSQAQPQNGLLAMLQLQALQQAQVNNSNPPHQPQNILAQILAAANPSAGPSGIQVPHSQNLNGLLAAIQQQQQLQAIRNVVAAASTTLPSGDDSDIPRKRAHTVSDPSSCRAAAIAAANKEESNGNGIGFGNLPADQQLVTMLSRLTTQENVGKISEMINNCISQRIQPISDDNNRLRREIAELRSELEAKKELVSRLVLGQQLHVANPQPHQVMETEEEHIEVDA